MGGGTTGCSEEGRRKQRQGKAVLFKERNLKHTFNVQTEGGRMYESI